MRFNLSTDEPLIHLPVKTNQSYHFQRWCRIWLLAAGSSYIYRRFSHDRPSSASTNLILILMYMRHISAKGSSTPFVGALNQSQNQRWQLSNDGKSWRVMTTDDWVKFFRIEGHFTCQCKIKDANLFDSSSNSPLYCTHLWTKLRTLFVNWSLESI